MSLLKLKSRGIGRLELLQWLNTFLETDYAQIEDLADGIAYLQIFDALYPGKVPLSRIKFRASSRSDYEANLAVLARVMKSCNVRKEPIQIAKLASRNFQTHLELLQWCHEHVHRICPDVMVTYRAYERRQIAQGKPVRKGTSSQQKPGSPLMQEKLDFYTQDLNPNLVPTITMRPGTITKVEDTHHVLVEDGNEASAEEAHIEEVITDAKAKAIAKISNKRDRKVPQVFSKSVAASGKWTVKALYAKEDVFQSMSHFKRMELNANDTEAHESSRINSRGRIPVASKTWDGDENRRERSVERSGAKECLREVDKFLKLLSLELTGRVQDYKTLQRSVQALRKERDSSLKSLVEIEKAVKASLDNTEDNESAESEKLENIIMQILHEAPQDFD